MIGWEIVARPAESPQRDLLGEGPFWDVASRSLWWVDIAEKRVLRLDPGTGALHHWTVGAYVSAAIPCETAGVILATPSGLVRFDACTGALTPFSRPDPDEGNRSNECRVDPRGRIWLGTMANNLHEDDSSVPIDRSTGGLFRVDGDGTSIQVLGGIGIANTLAWSPDASRMYFADSLEGVLWSFRFAPERPVLEDRRVHVALDAAPGVPDGSAVDEDGCLWNARWGGSCVIRVTPQGRIDRVLELPVKQPTCVAFGGSDLKTLYVTSARHGLPAERSAIDGALLAIPLDVAGLPSRRFAT